jgi:hypothetical protein
METLRTYVLDEISRLDESGLKRVASSLINGFVEPAPIQPIAPPLVAEVKIDKKKTKRGPEGRPTLPVVVASKRLGRAVSTEEVLDFMVNVMGVRVPQDRAEALRRTASDLSRASASIRKLDDGLWIHRSVKQTYA